MLLGLLHFGTKVPSWTHLSYRVTMKAESWFSWHVCFSLCAFCLYVCLCVYLWVTHCGQTPAHRLLVWLMNPCLQGVFEEVYCMPLFYSLKHPVLHLPLNTKGKINPVLTLPQWMAWAIVPSTISSSSEKTEKRIIDFGSQKREIKQNKTNAYRIWQKTSIFFPSIHDIHKRIN